MDSKQEVLDQVGLDLKLYSYTVLLAIVGITWPIVCLCVLGSHSVVCSYDFFLGLANVCFFR